METFLEELDALHAQVSQEAALIVDGQNDLLGAFVSIESSNTVDRETGMTIINQVPSLESVTPNMFTMFPTKTNVNVAVEGFWEGIANGIGKIFELIFNLIFGVLKLFIKPFEWLFGDGDSKKDGAIAKHEEILDNTIEKVTVDAGDVIKAAFANVKVIKDVVDNTKMNEWDVKILVNPDVNMYNGINDFIIDMYEEMVSTTQKFIQAYGKLKGGDAFFATHQDLLTVPTKASKGITATASKFLTSQFSNLGIDGGDVSDISKVAESYRKLEDKVRELESSEVGNEIIIKHYAGKLNNVRPFLDELKASLNFEKSDEELFDSVDDYTKAFEKLKDKINKLGGDDLEKLELSSTDVKKVRDAINLQLTVIRTTNNFIRIMTMVSIKGKRSLFKGIKLTNKIVEDAFANAKKST